jgi:hypothetical protein
MKQSPCAALTNCADEACIDTRRLRFAPKRTRRTNMRTVFAAAALGSVLLLGASADRAAAMPSATPSQLGLATADTGLVQKTAVICGRWGCRRVLRGARVWSGPRRRLYAFAGPRSSLAWSRPGWGWSSGPSWGWSTWGRPGWRWNRW